ncbi:helix-turn-helix transcriptional regulator [Salmonella enterica]|uniref:helix-turn-helix transcriptional regulator n=1 Tax=Salmonella enterica TaxID=28901 RepID=UPI0009AE0955|nr:LuxR C-terminal-related transcriptional regulator [Salmonella enterica]
MHQLFVVTSCNYTVAGFEALMAERHLSVRIIPVLTPEEVRITPPEGGKRIIVVVLPAREPAVSVPGRVFLWRRALHQMAGISDHALCLVLSDKTPEKYRADWRLHWPQPVTSLASLLIRALKHPDWFVSHQAEAWMLTPIQKEILDATLAGESVRATAARLFVNPQKVFSCRAALIRKLGLRNRMELMCLNQMSLE